MHTYRLIGFLLFWLCLASCTSEPPTVDGPLTIHYFLFENPAVSAEFHGIRRNTASVPIHTLGIDLTQSDFVLTEDQLVEYDWEAQTIIYDKAVHDWFLSDKARTSFPNYFVLTLGDTLIMAGTTLHSISSMGVNGPVLYIEDWPLHVADSPSETIRLFLRPRNFTRPAPTPIFPSDNDQFTNAVYARLQKTGKLTR